MREDNEYYWYWFVNIPGIGSAGRKRLLDQFGHPARIYEAGEKELSWTLTQKQMTYFKKSLNKDDIKKSKARLDDSGTTFIHWESEDYPDRLRDIFDPPYGLYLRGILPGTDLPSLAMIGSRKASVYGRKTAEYFAGALAECGVQIISGLASGIDAASHRGTLEKGGYTLGILGGGIDTIYPRENFNLYMEMYQKGGVLSEYNLGIPNYAGLFPMRNRLISGFADGIFVLEAGEKSGTFITVDQALEQGKEIFALPGRITDPLSIGCNRLIAQGAIPVQNPDDILDYMGGAASDRPKGKGKKTENSPALSLNREEDPIYRLIDSVEPAAFQYLLTESGYPVSKLQHILCGLELKGLIYQSGQQMYVRCEAPAASLGGG